MGADRAMIRVVHAMASNFLGGPERQLLGHARAADPAQWRIILASFPEQGREPAFIHAARGQNTPAAVFPVAGAYDPRAPWIIARVLRALGADLLCAHGYRMGILAPAAARLARVPLVSVWRGWTWENAKVRAFQAVGCGALRLADQVAAVSHAMAGRLARYRIKPETVAVVWNAVDAATLPQASPALRRQLRQGLGLADDALVLVSVGRLSPEKGHDILLRAMPEITARHPDAALLMVGDGPLRDRLGAVAHGLGVEAHARFLGFRSDAHQIIAGADLLVLPSLSEGLPNVMLEAMAIGVPAVATRVGGVPELLGDEKCGWMVEAANSSALADAVCAALADRARRAAVAERARARVERLFTYEAQARRYAEIYQAALLRRPRERGESQPAHLRR